MSVRVHLPGALARLEGVAPVLDVDVPGGDVEALIGSLDALSPGVGHRLCDGGRLRRHVLVFVAREQADLDSPVRDGDEVRFVAAVAGG